ncbi:hypothetical protein [Flavobacterium caeni]|uniref:Uncharacterized protein n=1 Tax=Flavobacterium caeni TaxID=490189 RepID=A0A1G5K2E4_9FLAO|nr:hypothetical protein [Flavobacterium caeni]SCY94391.1 hypothetical protein SAMN02927903_03024 [Flavobacterium caeni]
MNATKDQKLTIRRNSAWQESIKEEWVQWGTGDNSKTSLNDLTFEQADRIIKAQTGNDPDKARFQKFDFKNSQHKYILSMLHTVGWTKEHNGRLVGDMEAFGNWLQTRSPIKLPLTEQGKAQLQKTIYAFEQVVKHQFS